LPRDQVEPVAGEWHPTHVVPGGGLPTWSEPDGSRPSDNELAPGLEVQVLERQGEWAHVLCSNGWSTWVDGSALVEQRAPGGGAFFDQLAKPGNGLLAGAVALVAGAAVSYVLWPVLAVPGNILKDVIPRGDCTNEVPGSSGMYTCSVKAGALTALGPFLTVVAALVFRQPIAAGLKKITRGLPAGAGVLTTPLVATAMFTMVHASVHDKTADQTGIVPQRMFPALVGLFTFAATRLGPAVARRYGAAIDRRNRVPVALRVALALAVPLVSSYLLTNQERVSDTALKEQVVALLTLGTSYVALVPRDGDFLGAGQRLVTARLSRAGTQRSRR
jgi:hypothetical protein